MACHIPWPRTIFAPAITRNLECRWITPTLLIGGFIWFVLVSVGSVIFVGYEGKSVADQNFNETIPSWTSHFPLTPETKTCKTSIIKVDEGSLTTYAAVI